MNAFEELDERRGAILSQLPDAVRWFEGMRLQPQHFQQQSARLEMLAPTLLRAVEPLHWGLLRFRYKLEGMVVTVTSLEAIMPDGLVVMVNHEGAGPSIDLSGVAPEPGDMWNLSLAVPARAGGERAVQRRYLDQGGVKVADQNPDGVSATVSVLRPNLHLVSKQGHGFATEEMLPLLRVRRNGDALSELPYIAPWLRVGRGLPLYLRIEELCGRLRGNYNTLRDEKAADPDQQARRQALLPVLAARILELEATFRDGTAHPHVLFMQLGGLLGALSAALPDEALPSLENFDYRDIALAMTPLLEKLNSARTRLAPDIEWAPFGAFGKQRFQIGAEHLGSGPYLLALRKPVRASDADMQRWLENALVCSAGKHVLIQHRRSRGIGKIMLTTEQAREQGGDRARTLFQLDLSRDDAAECFDASAPLQIFGTGDGGDEDVQPLAIDLLVRPHPGA